MTGVKRQALLPLHSNDMWHEPCGNRVSRCSSTTPNFSPVERVEGKLDSMRQSHCIYALVQVSEWNSNAGRLCRAQAPGDLCMLLLRSKSCCNRFMSKGERGVKHAHSRSFVSIAGSGRTRTWLECNLFSIPRASVNTRPGCTHETTLFCTSCN